MERQNEADVGMHGGATLSEVAAELGISRERVRMIEESALRKLRRNARVMAMVRKLLDGRQ